MDQSSYFNALTLRSVCFCVSGTEARLFLLPGPFLPWCLAIHASGLLGSQLCPFSGSEVPSSYRWKTLSSDETETQSEIKKKKKKRGVAGHRTVCVRMRQAGNRRLMACFFS